MSCVGIVAFETQNMVMVRDVDHMATNLSCHSIMKVMRSGNFPWHPTLSGIPKKLKSEDCDFGRCLLVGPLVRGWWWL